MARKLFIGKHVSKKTIFVILEKSEAGILVEPTDKPFDGLLGGEQKMEKICTALYKFYTKEIEKTCTAEKRSRIFTISNLQSAIMAVNSDSGLMFLEPLTIGEMVLLHATYKVVGEYI